MKKLTIHPGVCGMQTVVQATYDDEEELVTLHVASGCAHIRAMMDTLGSVFDPIELCLTRPGSGPLYEYAAEHFPPHGACPVITGILKCAEAESGLALPRAVSFTFEE